MIIDGAWPEAREENKHAENYHYFYELRAEPGMFEFTTDCLPGLTLRSRKPAAIGQFVGRRFQVMTMFQVPEAQHEAYITSYPTKEKYLAPTHAAFGEFISGYLHRKRREQP